MWDRHDYNTVFRRESKGDRGAPRSAANSILCVHDMRYDFLGACQQSIFRMK
jgi:hypothetical protein